MGAVIGSQNALPFATAFTPATLQAGSNAISVALTYGSSSGRSAKITASARGRW